MNILDLLFPRVCLECKKEGKYLCGTCISKLLSVRQICPFCSKPSVDGFTHPKCLRPLGINGIISLWPYKGVIRKAILALKYKFVQEISDELGRLALDELKKVYTPKHQQGILTTVPLFWTRKNFRGYNQVDKIGEFISGCFTQNFNPELLVRNKSTLPQVELTRVERIKNVQGVFAANPKYKNLIKGRFIIILDDVYTTGSTLKEIAKILKRKGADEVWGLTLAK